MEDLQKTLKEHHYKKVKFKVTKSQHLLIKVSINGIKGDFILDTGASSSCIDFESVDYFTMKTSKSKTKASGAGATGMRTLISKENKLAIGAWKQKDFTLVVFDLSHVNQALLQHKTKAVHGIIGADVLQKGKSIIDYYNHCFYLK